MQRIARNLIHLRAERGWTQEQVAERGGFDIRWYQRLESGKYAFTLETLVRLAEVFRVDVAALIA